MWNIDSRCRRNTVNQICIVPQSLRCFCLHPRKPCLASKCQPYFTLKAHVVLVAFFAIFNGGLRTTATSRVLVLFFVSDSIAFNHFFKFFKFIAPLASVARPWFLCDTLGKQLFPSLSYGQLLFQKKTLLVSFLLAIYSS